MATTRKTAQNQKPRRPPATTPEAREQQMVALAIDVAEQQLLEGTASSQVISHYLKLGSSREQKEQRRMELEAQLLEKKIETVESAKRVEELYEDALKAMRSYSGQEVQHDDVYEE